MIASLLACLFGAVATGLLVRRTAEAPTDWPAQAFIVGSWITLVGAALLSALGLLGSVWAWSGIEAVFMVAAYFFRPTGTPSESLPLSTLASARWVRVSVQALAVTAALTIVANVVLVFGAAPGGWDGLAYHLPRMALAVEHGAFWRGPTNYWAQVAHPVGSTAMFVFSSVVSGHDEHAPVLWQMAAALVAAWSVRRIAVECGANREEALCAGLLFLLLPQTIAQAAAIGNDMILAALTAIGAERLLRYQRDGRAAHLVWVALTVGLGLAVKLVFVWQAAALLCIGLLTAPRGAFWSRAPRLVSAFAVAIALAAPAGYISNVRQWGSVVGPPQTIAQHTFAGHSLVDRATNGARNLLRYATDFVSLDGMPRIRPVLRAQTALRRLTMAPFDWIGVDLASTEGANSGFLRDRPIMAHEAHSFWGIAGVLLLWPAVVAVLLPAHTPARRALAAATIVFWILLSFSAPYDSFKGRYFLSSAVFACPLAIAWLRVRSLPARAFVAVAFALTIVTAVSSALIRSATPLLTVEYGGVSYPSILNLDRADQLARNRRVYGVAFREYERLVPADATVAVSLYPGSFEYVLFGPHLGRRVVPVGGRPLDHPDVAGADYVVFSDMLLEPRPSDIHLGHDWWLRPRH